MRVLTTQRQILVILAVLLGNITTVRSADAKGDTKMKIVRTYMNFDSNIDPAHILTMADLELSVALASTLIEFGDKREPISGIAKTWAIENDRKIVFKFRDKLKWSDGSPIKASEYRDSLLRAQRTYPKDLKSLFDSIESITPIDDSTLEVTPKQGVTPTEIILKLTEPMYGLVALKKNGELDLSKSSGAFSLGVKDTNSISLTANPNWFRFQEGMPTTVEIRKPIGKGNILVGFSSDPWVNLVSGHSIVKDELVDEFKKNGFKIWQRTEDKLFALYPSKKFIKKGGANVLKVLGQSLPKDQLLNGLTGFSIAEQFSPRGYTLWSNVLPKPSLSKDRFTGSIRVIVPESYYAIPAKERLPELIKKATGSPDVTVEFVPLMSVDQHMKNQDYDILATGIAVADPNFEGAISFFIERDPPFIPSSESPDDFSEQVKRARSFKSTKERAEKMREVLIRAQEAGFVLPLFHFSSIAVAKPGIDLSGVPNTDETIHFSKVIIR
jgi:MarR-like DNA-binding transcriptional regulator SgrR of sgrS sRNA